MNGASSAGANAPPPDRSARLMAALIDGGIASGLTMLLGGLPLLGGVVGAAYLVGRDGIEVGPMRFRSVGKYAMGLGLVRLDGRSMTLATSVERNWMLGVGAVAGFFATIPVVGGLLAPIISLAGFGFFVFEVYNVLSNPSGRRWGDRLGSTKVIQMESGVL